MNLPATCHKCNLPKRGFWEVEFEMDCTDCREVEAKARTEQRLREAVASGRIKVSSLTPLGRKVCGIS